METDERARPAAETPGDTYTEGRIPIATAFKDVGMGLTKVLRSEIRLATAELKQGMRVVGRRSVTMLVFALIGALGILPFMAFLVIGLGELLNHNYWLSSLIVAVVSFAVGGWMVYHSFKMMKEEDLSLPRTRRTAERHLGVVEDKMEEIRSREERGA